MSHGENRVVRSVAATRVRPPAHDSRRPRLVYGVAILLGLALAASAVAYNAAAPRAAAAEVKVGVPAPDAVFTTVQGAQRRLSQFRGKAVMLWLFTTWCDTCRAGMDAIASHLDQVNKTGLQVISLQLYKNLGSAGPPVADFASAFARAGHSSPNWVWGEASQEASYAYDPKGYPDVYFLISKDGVIRTISSAPNVTMDQILSFARQAR